MVPIADAFNHTNDHHVHLEADYNVCLQCGSLYECPHDRDEAPGNSCASLSSTSAVDLTTERPDPTDDVCYDMVTNSIIPPFTEVFNTYGENMSNAQLLSRYGFIIDGNEHDYLAWDVEEIFQFLNARLTKLDTKPGCGNCDPHAIWKLICDTLLEVLWTAFLIRAWFFVAIGKGTILCGLMGTALHRIICGYC
ncbi:hypothetical protein BD779DRAFT_508069 [Infundibulicybe gibba]|nr:hypothetical protein BD779DRAFT_508069 [Infundibulicybe gibba]